MEELESKNKEILRALSGRLSYKCGTSMMRERQYLGEEKYREKRKKDNEETWNIFQQLDKSTLPDAELAKLEKIMLEVKENDTSNMLRGRTICWWLIEDIEKKTPIEWYIKKAEKLLGKYDKLDKKILPNNMLNRLEELTKKIRNNLEKSSLEPVSFRKDVDTFILIHNFLFFNLEN